jgi:hypothetical protein
MERKTHYEAYSALDLSIQSDASSFSNSGAGSVSLNLADQRWIKDFKSGKIETHLRTITNESNFYSGLKSEVAGLVPGCPK